MFGAMMGAGRKSTKSKMPDPSSMRVRRVPPTAPRAGTARWRIMVIYIHSGEEKMRLVVGVCRSAAPSASALWLVDTPAMIMETREIGSLRSATGCYAIVGKSTLLAPRAGSTLRSGNDRR